MVSKRAVELMVVNVADPQVTDGVWDVGEEAGPARLGVLVGRVRGYATNMTVRRHAASELTAKVRFLRDGATEQ